MLHDVSVKSGGNPVVSVKSGGNPEYSRILGRSEETTKLKAVKCDINSELVHTWLRVALCVAVWGRHSNLSGSSFHGVGCTLELGHRGHCPLQEHRSEIDARATTFNAFETFGNQLLDARHYESDDIESKMNELAADREGKNDLKNRRGRASGVHSLLYVGGSPVDRAQCLKG